MENDQYGHFERQLQLKDFFTETDRARIERDLSRLFGALVTIVDLDAPVRKGWQRLAINWELEPVGYLEAENGSREQLAGAVDMLILLIKAAERYRMASDLHFATTQENYEALQKKHAALQLSEQKYRELSAHLKEKVDRQVQTIKNAQLKIYQSEKLASVGQLAAGVAHELNTPLAYILTNLSSAREYLDDI